MQRILGMSEWRSLREPAFTVSRWTTEEGWDTLVDHVAVRAHGVLLPNPSGGWDLDYFQLVPAFAVGQEFSLEYADGAGTTRVRITSLGTGDTFSVVTVPGNHEGVVSRSRLEQLRPLNGPKELDTLQATQPAQQELK